MGPLESQPRISTAFVVVIFAVAIVVGALVVYLGVNGTIGAGVP